MVEYEAPIREYDFLFNEVFEAIPIVQRLGYVLTPISYRCSPGVGRTCQGSLPPINQIGDRKGLKFEDGKITMPQEFKEAYRQGIEAGWMATSSKPEHGGMGAPIFFQSVIWGEIATSTNMAMSVLPALTLGVYDVLNEHGDKSLIDYFSNHLSSGEWAGTMCTRASCRNGFGNNFEKGNTSG